MKALTARFSHDPTCVWCEAPRDRLNAREKYPLRTPPRARSAAHLPPITDNVPQFPFKCDVCGLEFKDEKMWRKEAKAMEKEANQRMYKASHPGYVWRRECLLADVSHTVMCLLHMRLSFCNSLWNWFIKPCVEVKSTQVSNQVLKMLHQDGVNIWRLIKINSTSEVAAANASFTGGAADKVMLRFDEYLEVVECASKESGLVQIGE